MNNQHKRKLRKARKMMSPEEIKDGTSPFDNYEWRKKKQAAKIRVAKNIKKFQVRKMMKKKKAPN